MSTPITASVHSPDCTAEVKMKYLPQKPAKGGMPAMLNMKMAKATASPGSVRDRPARSEICSSIRPRRRMARMQAKVPAVMNT